MQTRLYLGRQSSYPGLYLGCGHTDPSKLISKRFGDRWTPHVPSRARKMYADDAASIFETRVSLCVWCWVLNPRMKHYLLNARSQSRALNHMKQRRGDGACHLD